MSFTCHLTPPHHTSPTSNPRAPFPPRSQHHFLVAPRFLQSLIGVKHGVGHTPSPVWCARVRPLAMPPRRGRPAASKAGGAAKGKAAPSKAVNQQQPSPQRRSARAKATAAEDSQQRQREDETEADKEAEEEEDEAGEEEEQQNGAMDGDELQEDNEAEEYKEADGEQSAPGRRSSRHSASAVPSKVKAATGAQRGASAQERELLALVDAIGAWKGSSSVAKEAMSKTLKQAATLLAEYRSTERSVTPSTADIPAADRPLLKTIAKAMVQRSVLQNKADEVAHSITQALGTHRIPHSHLVVAHVSEPDVCCCVCIQLRLLAACCLTDLLRIFAPQHPYDDKEIQVSYADTDSTTGC